MKTRAVLLLALAVAFSSLLHADSHALELADHVVINEVDTNPPGDDAQSAAEWVEIYNPTTEPVDIGGWEIASTVVFKKTLTIPPVFELKPGQYQIFSYQPTWFSDLSESIELRDSQGTVVDKTPALYDTVDGYGSWQRVYDGLDSDSTSDWVFATSTAGVANGSVEAVFKPTPVLITVGSDRTSYVLGETAIISGTVSERVFVEKPTFLPEFILITVDGPDYQSTVTLYPGASLEFSTTLALQEVMGVKQGAYNITAEYSGEIGTAQFSVGHPAVTVHERQSGVLSIQTDSDSYVPGQTATISATTTEEVPYAGLRFNIVDPGGSVVEEGTLFPRPGANTGGEAQSHFVTELFIDTVSPVYGTYQIAAEYSSQDAEHYFSVIPDEKDPSIVSLETDRPVYRPGDTVEISGRSNMYHVPALSLEILRSASLAPGTAGGTGLKVLDTLRLEGDGTFSYGVPIPDSFASFGEYRVTVSGEIGTFTTKFAIVEDPGTFVEVTDPFIVSVDKASYGIGDPLKISGLIMDYQGTFEADPVHIEIRDSGGRILSFVGGPEDLTGSVYSRIDLYFTAIPDPAGVFSVDSEITRSFFTEGVYTVLAQHDKFESQTSFAVVDPADTGSTGLDASLDKEVYGLGETLTLSGSLGIRAAGGGSVQITLYKPDGDTDKFEASLDGGAFSWSWNTPARAVVPGADNERAAQSGNLGVYRIGLEAEGIRTNLPFKVSANPETDTLNRDPITVDAGQSVYLAGDKLYVSGYVVPRGATHDGLGIPELVTVEVMPTRVPLNPIHTATVYPDQGGYYSTAFDLLPSLFHEGAFKVRASYNDARAETSFSVAESYLQGGEDPELILTLDKDSYNPGDVLTLDGRPSKIVHLGQFAISVIKQSDHEVYCGSFYCGRHAGPISILKPDPLAAFTHTYAIPETDSVGSYEIVVDAGFDTKSVTFDVAEKPEPGPARIIEKASRIPDSSVSIAPEAKTSGGLELIPRVLSGMLITPSRGEEPAVNFQVHSPGGACVIGQAPGCLVSESTRAPGAISTTVTFDDSQYMVRYSGPDAKLEKFSIVPALDGEPLPMGAFDVSVIKDDQPSRIYYKITYTG